MITKLLDSQSFSKVWKSAVRQRFCALISVDRVTLPTDHLRLVFTSDGVVVGVVIRRVERYDLAKIQPTESEAEH